MARAVFLALLAANLVFLGWQLVSANDRAARSDWTDDFDVPLLSLASEDAQQFAEEETSDAQIVAADGSVTRCLSLGPFADDETFEAARSKLAGLGLSGTRRHAEGQIWVGYWIFLSPERTREEALEKVKLLRERGVGDIYAEPSGERENAVSLGVFKDRNRAQRRYREIRDLGFEPQIARRTRQGTVYWLDFVPAADVRIDPADFQISSGRIVRLASRVCQSGGVQIE